jgi:cytochrome c-type biogenesis protein CcmE
MTRRQRRLVLVLSSVGVMALAVTLMLMALGDNVTFFYSPSDLKTKSLAPGQRINLGGLVEKGSVVKGENALVTFTITDGSAKTPVRYNGILPDLFREGQGVVTTGRMGGDGVFQASSVLAKHDETYMPPEVAKALKDRGVWKEGEPLPNTSVSP